MEEKEVYENFVKGSVIIAIFMGGFIGALILASTVLGLSLGPYWRLVQTHSHLELFGWLGLFIMGISYHVIPRFKATQLYNRGLANISFWLMILGVLLRGSGISSAWGSSFKFIVLLSSLLELSAVAIFLYVMIKTILSSDQKPEIFEQYVFIALIWFFIGSILNLGISIHMVKSGFVNVPIVLNKVLIHVILYGFATMMIMGVSVRTLPIFLGLKEGQKQPIRFVLVFFNLGVIISVISPILIYTTNILETPSFMTHSLLIGGVLLEFLAVIAFIYSLNIFKKPEIKLPTLESSINFEISAKGGYVWLLFVVVLNLYLTVRDIHEDIFVYGAYIHSLTIGFITMMMFGFSNRVIPVFKGVNLYSLRLANLALFLLIGGNLIRVFFELFYPFLIPLKIILGFSGFITLSAYAIFGFNIWATINTPYQEE
tara:strand:+ start:257 stop:1543 length:1287 start_codon:yes stop_codon:yes gene_type:complete